jgi:hypothetical protein
MATSLCGSAGYQNTGNINCDLLRGVPKILLVGDGTFSSSNYADQPTMDAAIVAKLKLNNGNSQKLYPFPVVEEVTDQSEAAKIGSTGLGLKFKLVRSRPGYEFGVIAGSSLEKKLIAFDGKKAPIVIFDDKSQFWGVKDSAANFAGAQWLIGVDPHGYGDGNNVKLTKITISLVDAADFVENASVHVSALTSAVLSGLKDVAMSVLSLSSNVYKVKLKIATAKLGGDLDIWDDFGSIIAGLTFTATTGVNYGTAMVITSVAVDNTLKALTVTFDSTQYSALSAGAKIKLIPPTVVTLDTANATGIEIGELIITK